MFGDKEFIGLSLEGDYIKLAHVKRDGNRLVLLNLDRVTLQSEVNTEKVSEASDEPEEESLDADSIFGIEGEEPKEEDSETIDAEELEGLEDIDEDDLMSFDMQEQEETVRTNEMLLHDLLDHIGNKRLQYALNVPIGNTIFQILKEQDYKELKKKDLKALLESRLESIYGESKSEDHYAYEFRNDGAIVLASNDGESPMPELVNSTQEIFEDKYHIADVLPDEVVMVGLIRSNYVLVEDEITAVLEFGPEQSRIVFMKGDQIWHVAPMIQEGTNSKNFLSTLFSKLLFQLDAGEVPNLDRIILANNSMGETAVEFFKENFQNLKVDDFNFHPDLFDHQELNIESVRSFTTAIGLAWAASGLEREKFPDLTFLPEYVSERQKVFKLQWHGVLLLLMIGLAPLTFNYFYQSNVQKITTLDSQVRQTEARINSIQPTVESVNSYSQKLSQIQEKMVMLDSLTSNTRKWTKTISMIDDGFKRISNCWLISLRSTKSGLQIQGYSLYRNRIPQITDLFYDATLDNVTTEEMRDLEVYRFSITVRKIVEDPSEFSTPMSNAINQLFGEAKQ